MDDEFLPIFTEEAEFLLRDLESALLALERAPSDAGLVDRIFRGAHTLKGNAAMLGLTELAQLAHGFESALVPVRAGDAPCSSALTSALLLGRDALAAMVSSLAGGPAPGPEVLAAARRALQAHATAVDATGFAAALAAMTPADAPPPAEPDAGAPAGGGPPPPSAAEQAAMLADLLWVERLAAAAPPEPVRAAAPPPEAAPPPDAAPDAAPDALADPPPLALPPTGGAASNSYNTVESSSSYETRVRVRSSYVTRFASVRTRARRPCGVARRARARRGTTDATVVTVVTVDMSRTSGADAGARGRVVTAIDRCG